MPDADFPRIINESEIALQICQAGNIRTALMCLDMAIEADAFDRLIFATDTPTGTGVMPLGMIKTVVEMACLSKHSPEMMLAAATGNNANVYKINTGFIKRGRAADVILLDAPLGSSAKTALDAIKHGDYPAVAAAFTDGIPRYVGRSRNTPPSTRQTRIAHNTVMQDFGPGRHTV
jgi:enamidase